MSPNRSVLTIPGPTPACLRVSVRPATRGSSGSPVTAIHSNDGGLAERVRVHALDEEGGFVDVRDEHRGLLAGDAEQHLVGEPLDHRVQVAQVGDVRPERLGLPGLVQLALRQLPVERHLHPLGDVVLLQVVRRQHREPLHQVVRRREGEHLAVVVDVQGGAGEVQGLTGERLGRGEQVRARRRVAARRRLAGRRPRRAGRRGSHRPRSPRRSTDPRSSRRAGP